MEWKSIETAPKDGTAILLCRAYDADGVSMDKKSFGIFCQVAAWWIDEQNGEGEWIVYCSLSKEPGLHFEPTHWMPLPKQPK